MVSVARVPRRRVAGGGALFISLQTKLVWEGPNEKAWHAGGLTGKRLAGLGGVTFCAMKLSLDRTFSCGASFWDEHGIVVQGLAISYGTVI